MNVPYRNVTYANLIDEEAPRRGVIFSLTLPLAREIQRFTKGMNRSQWVRRVLAAAIIEEYRARNLIPAEEA